MVRVQYNTYLSITIKLTIKPNQLVPDSLPHQFIPPTHHKPAQFLTSALPYHFLYPRLLIITGQHILLMHSLNLNTDTLLREYRILDSIAQSIYCLLVTVMLYLYIVWSGEIASLCILVSLVVAYPAAESVGVWVRGWAHQ